MLRFENMLAEQGLAETRNLKPEAPFLNRAKPLKSLDLFSPCDRLPIL